MIEKNHIMSGPGPERRDRGLGDAVARVIEVVHLDVVAHAYTDLTGHDCGCGARREALNRFGEKVKENLASLRRLR